MVEGAIPLTHTLSHRKRASDSPLPVGEGLEVREDGHSQTEIKADQGGTKARISLPGRKWSTRIGKSPLSHTLSQRERALRRGSIGGFR